MIQWGRVEECSGLHCIDCAGGLGCQMVRSQVMQSLHVAKGLHHLGSYVGGGDWRNEG